MPDLPPRIALESTASGESITLYGSWSAAALAQWDHWTALEEVLLRQPLALSEAQWDLRQIARLDHTGAQLLWNTWGHAWPRHVLVLDLQRSTLNRVALFTVPPPKPRSRTAKQDNQCFTAVSK